MDGESNVASTPIPWSLMLEYERADAVLQLFRQFSFFHADKLLLIEREEVICSPGMDSERMEYLVIHGSVGNARKEAFLKLLRLARLTLVQDMASQVVVCPQIGDLLPNTMLHPLWETSQVRSFKKWNRIYWAMRCGLLKKIKRRREMIQAHVEQVLGLKAENLVQNSSVEAAGISHVNEEAFYNSFWNLLELEQEEQNAPLELYYTACSEERVNLSTVIATVPTLILLWASWDITSMEWLRENLFNVTKILKANTLQTFSSTYSSSMKDDPWVETVMRFVQLPRRIVMYRRTRLKRYLKRAQIVLISVDREKAAAVDALNGLFSEVSGWKSPEVPLIPLWCGPDGLQSDLATELNIAQLPFFVATQLPDKQTRKLGDGRFPRICYITSHTEGEIAPDACMKNNEGEEVSERGFRLMNWHAIEKKEREIVMSAISRFLAASDAPLRFIARVDRTYQMNPASLAQVKKRLKPEVTSFVTMSGTISTLDLMKLKEKISLLSRVRNFFFDVKIMKPSIPLLIQLNPKTPTRYVLGSARNITCSECIRDVLIDKEHHFRCIQCDQSEGVVCWMCFAAGKHPQHHVLLRVPTFSETTLNLLWGPSNVSPLALFCGKLVSNINETHVGVYCNGCSQLICGVRWKCAMCYQYDLCDCCDEKRNRREALKCEGDASTPSGGISGPIHTFTPPSTHPKEHLFLCIRHGCGADGDACLNPVIEKTSLPLFISQ
ncbi:putative E3 ubiquitin-protein ligase KCMF1 [Trypanosoma cruzi]|uniref:Putative E3 ubiquitin-protein ligase KCMF1 n=1 Tax=Trypanosoma cruzi TaxID=5693 RepID=A0A2V2WLJ0_TRYCR|nr:putative E3 ubiquitin-protein ligase KCMF1 [Trypanosoma cruzi]